MTAERELLRETVFGIVGRHGASARGLDSPFDAGLWAALAEHGLTLAAAPEEAGGSGASLADAAVIVRVAGATAIAGPLPETLLVASWLLTAAGMPLPAVPITVAPDSADLRLRRDEDGWHVDGTLARVPWAREASCVVAVVEDASGTRIVSLSKDSYAVTPGVNMAGEPRDDLSLRGMLTDEAVAAAPAGVDRHALWRRGALARAIAMTGALERARDLTVAYVAEREQFGRPIGRFQAVQQQLGELVAECAAADAAVDAAVDAVDAAEPGRARFGVDPGLDLVAVAKIRAGRAASVVATIAHQLHGAIGVTEEYDLHRFTRRLWSWRDEFGSETAWSAGVGRAVAAHGGDGLWPQLTEAGAWGWETRA